MQREQKKIMDGTSKSKKKSYLTPARIEALENLGFEWTKSAPVNLKKQQEFWEARYQELVQFHQEHGHCNVPRGHENQVLATWVRTICRLGLPVVVAGASCCSFVQFRSSNFLYFFQVDRQRTYKKIYDDPQGRNQTILTPANVELLDELGFSWTLGKPREGDFVTPEEVWQMRFRELAKYKAEHGEQEVVYLWY